MSFVLDASVALAWCFRDEASALTEYLLRRAARDGCVVPAHFRVEIANVLSGARRRGRIAPEGIALYLGILRSLPIAIDRADRDVILGAVLDLSQSASIAAYDAAYVDLARRLGLPLATIDRDMVRAATAIKVEVVRR